MQPARLLAVGVLTIALAGCSSAPPTVEVLGFAESGGAESITANASALTYVGIDGVTLTDGGASIPVPDDDAVAALDAAHKAGLKGELLFSNFDGELGDFSPDTASTLLADPSAAVSSLADIVRNQGWDGLMIDLESMTAADAEGLAALARDLRAALGAGPRLDIAIMAATDAVGYRAWGYDLPALAESVDRFTIMTYDQHGTWSDAGPVGALGWQRDVVDALLAQVPADRIDLGLAGYGYLWGPDDRRSVSVAEARELAGDNARFDDEAGEWTATLDDGSVLWWSDSRSQALRADLAAQLGLAGVAIWSLGLSDPIPHFAR